LSALFKHFHLNFFSKQSSFLLFFHGGLYHLSVTANEIERANSSGLKARGSIIIIIIIIVCVASFFVVDLVSICRIFISIARVCVFVELCVFRSS